MRIDFENIIGYPGCSKDSKQIPRNNETWFCKKGKIEFVMSELFTSCVMSHFPRELQLRIKQFYEALNTKEFSYSAILLAMIFI